MTKGPDLYAIGQSVSIGDRDEATVGFAESFEGRVAVRVRFPSQELLRKFANSTTLDVDDVALPWETTIGGGGPLASVADIVFRGVIPPQADEIVIGFISTSASTTSRLLIRPIVSP